MPQYLYTAMNAAGKECKGKINAENEEAATLELRAKNLFVTSMRMEVKVKKTKSSSAGGGGLNLNLGPMVIKKKELTVVTRQLAILLAAGLPLIRSLRTLEKQAKNPSVRGVLAKTSDIVEGGATFAEALEQSPKSFDKLYLNMVRAGEASGAMEIILDRLAGFMEKAARIAGKVKSAMIYPTVILSISILAIVGLMIFIVPNFRKIFADLLGKDEKLPDITEFLIAVSDSMVNTWYYWLIGVAVIIISYKIANKTKYGKFGIDWCKYRMPLFGPIIAKTAVSRFSRTLGTLMSSGVPVLSALAIVKETSGNEVVAKAVEEVYGAVKEGEGIAAPLSKTKVFPEMVISMVEVGEETGKLPEMLEKIANTYEEDVDNAVSALTSLIEPLMIVALAGMVGTIVIALFLPLTKIIEKMSG